MKQFEYLMPKTLADATSAWADPSRDARLLAGGTDLNVALRHGHVQTDVVIDLKRIEVFAAGITVERNCLRIPATTTMTALTAYLHSHELFPALQEAAAVVGSIQIRNRATLVGNICNASPAADTVPVLAAMGASVEIGGSEGDRYCLVENFIEGNRKTDLARGEIVTAVLIPLSDEPIGCAFDRITRRRGVDLATANLCTVVASDGTVTLAFGAVSPQPLVLKDTSGILSDPTANAGDRAPVIRELSAHATPISDVRASAEYRTAMLGVMIERSLGVARQRLEEASFRG